MLMSTEIRRLLKPLILVNSILATGLLEYYDDCRINAIGFIYVCFSMIFYAVSSYIIIFVWNVYIDGKALMLQVTHHIHIFSHTFFYFYTIMAGIFRRKNIKHVLMQMETCMRAMDELGIPKNYVKYFRHLCYVLLCTLIILMFMAIIDIGWMRGTDGNYFILIFMFYLEHYPFIMLSTAESSFVFWIIMIKTKFGELNAVLRGMLMTTIDSPQHKRVFRIRDNRNENSSLTDIYLTYKTDTDTKKIKRVKQIHLELIKWARLTNMAYGWHILMSMTTAFILLTTIFYNVYSIIFETLLERKYDLLGFSYWIFYLVFKIIVISHVCSATKAEIREFTSQLIQNPLTFTACGFFDLDHTFIRSVKILVRKIVECKEMHNTASIVSWRRSGDLEVIGSVTTYLVILIQVGNTSLKFLGGNTTISNY